MRIYVEDNPNCSGTDEFEYKELGPAKLISAIKAEDHGKEIILEVTGISADGVAKPAQCMKIADSGAGFAFLIFGAEWGIRLKPQSYQANWNLSDSNQWGEPFKIYGSEEDIIYG